MSPCVSFLFQGRDPQRTPFFWFSKQCMGQVFHSAPDGSVSHGISLDFDVEFLVKGQLHYWSLL